MRLRSDNSNFEQLDFLDASSATSSIDGPVFSRVEESVDRPAASSAEERSRHAFVAAALPALLPVDRLEEDPGSPRTEFPDEAIGELADDIALRGILQPIVVRPGAADGCYQVLFGTKRLRAARRAGLDAVPVVIGSDAHDGYAQVAENQKRQGLSPLDLARFIKSRSDAGESNGTIGKRLGMNLTTVAHHLTLLELPPVLDQALRSGRCTSPRTLHELSRLHAEAPERVRALLAGKVDVTRTVVREVRSRTTASAQHAPSLAPPAATLLEADAACTRLEQILTRVKQRARDIIADDLAALRQRVANLASRLE